MARVREPSGPVLSPLEPGRDGNRLLTVVLTVAFVLLLAAIAALLVALLKPATVMTAVTVLERGHPPTRPCRAGSGRVAPRALRVAHRLLLSAPGTR